MLHWKWKMISFINSGYAPGKHSGKDRRQVNQLITGGNADHLPHTLLCDSRMKRQCLQSYRRTALGDGHLELIRKVYLSTFSTDKKQAGPAFGSWGCWDRLLGSHLYPNQEEYLLDSSPESHRSGIHHLIRCIIFIKCNNDTMQAFSSPFLGWRNRVSGRKWTLSDHPAHRW